MVHCPRCREAKPRSEFYRNRAKQNGLQIYCKPCWRASMAESAARDPVRYRAQRARQMLSWRRRNPERANRNLRSSYDRLRADTFEAYGNACRCCGEAEPKFLCIDHVHNDGARHRRELGRTNLWRWLRAKGFPQDGFQLLCHNCNMAKGLFGECPHRARARLSEVAL